MAHKSRLSETSRLIPVENIDAAYANGAEWAVSKDGRKIVTTKLLSSYAKQFASLFKGCRNVYDASKTGIDLSIGKKTTDGISFLPSLSGIIFPEETSQRKERTENFISEEISALEKK